MAVGFNSIPIDLRTPGVYVEFDTSRASNGASGPVNRVLVYGQKLAAGTAAAGVAVQVRTADEAKALFGRGSMLAKMIETYRKNDAVSELWAVPLADDAGGTAQTKTITVTGTATAAGSLIVRIAGQRLTISVASGATPTVIATAIVAAVTAAPDLPVTAANAAGVVTLTAKHKGEAGKDIDVRVNSEAGELLPASVTTAVASVTAGAGNPSTASVFTAIGDQPFTAFVCPYTDSTSLGALEAELAVRWGPMKNLDGLGYAAAAGALNALTTLGAARNSQFVTIIGAKASPTPPWEWAAAYAAQVSYSAAVDPARPFQTLTLLGVTPPAIADRFIQSERDSLLRDGISTFTVQGSTVSIERAITTYQTNALGVDDVAWLDVNTPLTLATLRFTLRSRIATKYGRHKLVKDDVIAPGQAAIGPKGLRAEIIAWFQDCEERGWVENLEQFKADLVVEVDPTDASRVNALIPPDLVSGLRVLAAVIQPRL